MLFYKMHGAGNDFILFDNRNQWFPYEQTNWIQTITHRHFGIGSDGIILLEPNSPQFANQSDGRMVFLNPDGSRAAFCGNGTRCFALFLQRVKGIHKKQIIIETDQGLVQAEIVKNNEVKIHIPFQLSAEWNKSISIFQDRYQVDFIHIGVPHAVLWWDNLEDSFFEKLAPLLRQSREFGPNGTNVDFACKPISTKGSLRMRTFERGVEGETLACGSGVLAVAGSAAYRWRIPSPIIVTVQSGYQLKVYYEWKDQLPQPKILQGHAELVFQGILPLP